MQMLLKKEPLKWVQDKILEIIIQGLVIKIFQAYLNPGNNPPKVSDQVRKS